MMQQGNFRPTVDKREKSTSTLLSSVSTDSIDKQPPGFLSFKQHQAESRRNNLVIGEGKEGPVEGAHDDQNIGEEQACQAAVEQRIQAIYEEQTAKAITDSSSSTESFRGTRKNVEYTAIVFWCGS